MGWVCLASCGTDVTINALALYWVTAAQNDGEQTETSLPPVTTQKIGETRHSVRPAQGIRSQGRCSIVAPFEYAEPHEGNASFHPLAKDGRGLKPSGGLLKKVSDMVTMSKGRDDDDHNISVQVRRFVPFVLAI